MITSNTVNKGSYYYGAIGNFDSPVKHVIIQSLWTKPLTNKEKLKDTLYMAALSLEYAHRSGYIVHMHTDTYGESLLKTFGYDALYKTLDSIPSTVPTDLFAAGKFYAMKAEGIVEKIHVDLDVFIKKPHLLDVFYENPEIDIICQQEEDKEDIDHQEFIKHMFIMGYPTCTRPNWNGSLNTGVIGFNNAYLATKYFNNYDEALKMYKQNDFIKYKMLNGVENLYFDFILEQVTLSHMSVGYNVHTLVPGKDATYVADKIGYQHLQGTGKWGTTAKEAIKRLLKQFNYSLYRKVQSVTFSM